MPTEVVGADQFFALAKRLKKAGERDLQQELNKGLARAVKPLRAAIKQSARDTLPRSGGLGPRVARSGIRQQRRSTGRSAGIRLVATSGYDIGAMDRGRLRHPLFGNRHRSYTQIVTPGWWSRPTERAGPEVRAELIKAMDVVKAKVEER